MAKPKPSVAIPNPAAVACGSLAGVGTHFETIKRELQAVIERCDKASATALLTDAQESAVRDVREKCLRALIPTIESLWRDIDGVNQSGVAMPVEQSGGEDLF